MLIGVVSDTHLLGKDNRFYNLVEKYFNNCHMILHAGDIVDMGIFDGIDKNIVAVKGNMDFGINLPYKRVLEVEGVRIGLIHGYGAPQGIEFRIVKEFEQENIDCIVFGHIHKPFIGELERVKLFNPGSPFDNRYGAKKTIGFMEIHDSKINFRIEEI